MALSYGPVISTHTGIGTDSGIAFGKSTGTGTGTDTPKLTGNGSGTLIFLGFFS